MIFRSIDGFFLCRWEERMRCLEHKHAYNAILRCVKKELLYSNDGELECDFLPR